MFTCSSHSFPSTILDELCKISGAVYRSTTAKSEHPLLMIRFPKNESGLTPSIKVVALSSLEEATHLNLQITIAAPDIFPLLQLLIILIRQHKKLTSAQEDNITTAIHEALLNAMIHGNIGVHSDYHNAYKLFDHFALISEMLTKNKKPKPIIVQMTFSADDLTIAITDQGKGFSEHAIVPPGETALHGRGMAIIRECSDTVDITDGGRTIVMRFASTTMPPNTPTSLLQFHILIVEDIAVNRAIIQEILIRRGFINISLAIDGAEAYQKTLDLKPDLVLLDLQLPKMNGYECCRKIRQHPEFKDLPIVIQTALSKEEERSKAFACGASDLVTKPINAYELVARITLHLERQELLRSLRTYQYRVRSELESARKMQESVLPSASLIKEVEGLYNLSLHSYFKTSSEIGGDIWGVSTISDKAFAIYTADFSGHGITAALNAFRLQAVLQSMFLEMHSPSVVLQKINEKLSNLLDKGQFATMFFAVINLKENTLNYAAAGSPSQAIVRNNKKVEWLDSKGLPLGIDNHYLYETKTIRYLPGDSLFFYSDALIETENTKGEVISQELLESVLPAKTASSSFEAIKNLFKKHCNNVSPDDLTIVMLHRNELA